MNPKGVTCLYTATNAETAMMETRPWAGFVLTVSQLVLLKQVTVVDCTLPATFDLDIKTQEQLESNSWYILTRRSRCRYFKPKALRITRRPSTPRKPFERQDTAES